MLDIMNGERNKCARCPVALALARALDITPGDTQVVSVGPYSASWVGNKTGRAMLPMAAQDFIEAFDLANTVKPFEFTLYPQPSAL